MFGLRLERNTLRTQDFTATRTRLVDTKTRYVSPFRVIPLLPSNHGSLRDAQPGRRNSWH